MKKLFSVALVFLVLCTSVISACAESLTIEDVQEQIYNVVGYKPYCIEECYYDDELEMEVRDWSFIMHGGVISTWSVEEDLTDFLELAADYQYDWYRQLPEMVEISITDGLDIPGQGIHFEVNPVATTNERLVVEWMVWGKATKEFELTEDGYIFSKKVLADIIYIDEMACIRYWAELLEEAMY